MEKYSQILGLPVICVDDGKKIGEIKDVLLEKSGRKFIGMSLKLIGYKIKKKLVLLEDVVSIGDDALIINDISCLKSIQSVEKDKNIDKNKKLLGLRIYTKKGEDIGVVKDFLLDFKTGRIDGFEISDGILQDVIKGRRIIPLLGKVEFAKENILIDKESIEEMLSTGGGLEKIINKK